MERRHRHQEAPPTMEKRLYEASLSGSVESLNELMKEDPLILARTCVTCFNDTPLHVAAMLGHVDFAKALLRHKPDLVTHANSQGFSPLHLATANGYVEIVKNLLLVNTDVCLSLDVDGRTPLHLAVMKGQTDIVKELVGVRPEAIRYKLDRGENILHSCVKHNRLGALKLIVESTMVDDFINDKDEDGSTILHMATALKQMETIKYLLSSCGVKVNAVNGNGFTALNIIENMPRDLKGMEIRESLLNAGADVSGAVMEARRSCVPKRRLKKHKRWLKTVQYFLLPKTDSKMRKKWLGKMRDSLMVAATVIAAMAYQAGLSPPGGVWQEDFPDTSSNMTYLAGTSIMTVTDPFAHSIFWLCNTVSFVGSLITILLLVSGLPLEHRIFLWTLMGAMWVTISCMAVAYMSSMSFISTHAYTNDVFIVARVSLYLWFVLIVFILLLQIVRFLMWGVPNVRNRKKRSSNTVTTNCQEEAGQV